MRVIALVPNQPHVVPLRDFTNELSEESTQGLSTLNDAGVYVDADEAFCVAEAAAGVALIASTRLTLNILLLLLHHPCE